MLITVGICFYALPDNLCVWTEHLYIFFFKKNIYMVSMSAHHHAGENAKNNGQINFLSLSVVRLHTTMLLRILFLSSKV